MKIQSKIKSWTLLIFLIPAVFSFFKGLHFCLELILVFTTTTEELFRRDVVTSFTYTQATFPLSLWLSFTSKIRAEHFGNPFPLRELLTSDLMSPSVTMYFAIFACGLGILLLGMLLLIVSSCLMCCNKCCCKARLRQKYTAKKPPGAAKKACALFLMVIPYLIIGVCIFIHITGSNFLSLGIQTLGTGFQGSITAFNGLIDGIPSNFAKALDDLGANVNTSIDATLTAVNYVPFYSDVTPPWNLMVTNMYSIANESVLMNGYLSSYNTKLAALKVDVETLSTSRF
jgi:hypothetical protein